MAAIAVSALPGSYSYVRGHGCRVVGGHAVASTLAGARLASRLVSSQRWRAADLGRGLRTTGRRAYDGRSIRGGGISLARAVWKQEVLWTEAPIADIGFAAEQHFHLVLDISANRELRDGHTKPGQFVQVRIGDSKPAFLAIASPPRLAATGSLEFLLKSVEGTTAGLLCSLQKGDKVELSQVMGNGFGVEQVSPAEDFPTILLFATGSGISPIHSLLEAGFDAHKRRDVRLYYGARNLDRMAYQDKFKDWEASGVEVVPVLSQPHNNWTGEQGYVQAAFAKTKGHYPGSSSRCILMWPQGNGSELKCKAAEHGKQSKPLHYSCTFKDVTALLLADGVPKEQILLNF
ncbi:unnamed protein product [Sphagnum jensenii]|uniref:FAD-binding FR-type domain-containing protein n=1 Tax=Sphagnum jensenii TaxID=128206 RepID=A0ABP0W3Q1_9BRYO